MSVATSLRGRLDRFEMQQLRFLRAAAGQGLLPPFGDEQSTLRALARRPAPACEGLRVAYRDDAGEEHLGFVLSPADLGALGVAERILDEAAPEGALLLLAPHLERSLQRAGVALGRPLRLQATRMQGVAALQPLPWRFVAEGVPGVGELVLALSSALLEACVATPAPRRSQSAAGRITIGWALALPPLPLAEAALPAIEPGDVLRVPARGEGPGRIDVRLVPRSAGRGDLPSFAVQAVIDPDRWIAFQLQSPKPESAPMADSLPLDAMTVPVEAHLPIIAMSLAEIEAVRPGALVDCGVRLEDVEVTLSSAGRPFAVGRLVLIGDDLGVEIVRTAGGRT